MDSIQSYLTPELNAHFHEKSIEFGTSNRTYCSNSRCSAFLRPAKIDGERGECPICFTSTCTVCKEESHKGNCPEDEGVQQVLTLGAEEGWKQCNRCNRMIELRSGCNHITCPCKAQWCYVCGVEWKNCECAQWDEQRLLERAAQNVNRRPARANRVVNVARANRLQLKPNF